MCCVCVRVKPLTLTLFSHTNSLAEPSSSKRERSPTKKFELKPSKVTEKELAKMNPVQRSRHLAVSTLRP